MIFSHKIALLLRRRGLSARALATTLDLSNSTVAGWLKSARPQAAQAKQIADYFEVSVDALLDDALDLPESPQEYLAEAPIKTASRLAEAKPGRQSDRQQAFEEYLGFLHRIRAEAEAAAPNDPVEARRIFDHALATWLTTQEAGAGAKNLTEIITRGRDATKERRQA